MVGETGSKGEGRWKKIMVGHCMYVLTYVSLPIRVVFGYNWWGHIAFTEATMFGLQVRVGP